ncbi:hypothetical protein F4604DRAFT_1935911 [Suillus subluteus]|nr:hypothetical protein F4604DRAFT_1935911 [Suillus subluteus]
MKRGFQRDADAARELLSEVLDVCHADSHTHRPALLAIRTSAQHQAGSATANDLVQEQLTAFVLLLMPDQLAKQAVWCHRRDEPRALDEVISLHYDALKCYNTVDAYRGQLLSNLSAIALQREALDLQPVSHTFWSSLDNLANQLSTCFEHRGNNKDLDQAITLCREVLALHPVSHTDQSLSLRGLANLLSSCFEQQGNDKDLDQAIALQREVLALCPVGHTAQSSSLKDLDQAIALHGEALALCLIGHTDRFISLNNLANILSSCFEHQGDEEVLDQAIALQREALAWHPVGNDEDLDQAIALDREVLALCPVGHTDRSRLLNNLVKRLSSHFKHQGNEEDLDQAIALHREALALHPVGHTDRSSSLNNLANELSSRFEHRGHDKDLDQAIALHREALALCLAIALQREVLALCLVGHTDRSSSLNNLVNQLCTRFEHQHNREDFDESQDNLRCALTLLTQHDPHQLVVHKSLAVVYLSFRHSGLDGTGVGEDNDSLNAVMHHLKAAANVVSGGSLSCLQASLRWVHHACQHSHATELEAYTTSMQFLDAFMSTTASVSSRHNIMMAFPSMLAVDAASCALRSSDMCQATCGDHAAALVKKFRDLSSLLDKPPANNREATSRVNAEAEEAWYRHLVKDWNGAVEEIRKIEGFSCFLLPPSFSNL